MLDGAAPIMGTEDEEFTTSAFCDGKGGFHAHMTLEEEALGRRLHRSGRGRAGRRHRGDGARPVRPFQADRADQLPVPAHIEGRLKLLGDQSAGYRRPPRSGRAFGYNECAMAVEYYLEGQDAAAAGHQARTRGAIYRGSDLLLMTIGIISDIHGNYEALKKVLAELDRMNVSEVICPRRCRRLLHPGQRVLR